MRALEPIYAALFALAQSVNSGSTPFANMSRRWVAWDQPGGQNGIQLFQLQKPIRVEGGARPLPVLRLQVEWYVYFPTDSSDFATVNATTLNNYLTALLSVLQGPLPGQQQTLGGLVTSVYFDGDIAIDEGVVAPPAILCIPITILTGF